MDRDEMLRVLRAFEQEGLEYVLIGAAAMGFHGLVRATEDLGIFIRATAENVERLKRAFRAAYAGDPNVDEIRAEDLLGDYPEGEGIHVRVATPEALYHLKKGTVRPLDRQDAEALRRQFGLKEDR